MRRRTGGGNTGSPFHFRRTYRCETPRISKPKELYRLNARLFSPVTSSSRVLHLRLEIPRSTVSRSFLPNPDPSHPKPGRGRQYGSADQSELRSMRQQLSHRGVEPWNPVRIACPAHPPTNVHTCPDSPEV